MRRRSRHGGSFGLGWASGCRGTRSPKKWAMAATDGFPAPDVAALTARPGPGSHRLTMVIDGRRVETLADPPPLRNRLLFVGLNPSPVSVAAGHYHQGRLGRRFWTRLIRAGIIPHDSDLETADD